ncbi:hypothetical protein LBMAG53_04510 [Planctomycetota bacterium]|nr:hypothetical protein LBMAG53_04510 [Planctomycetota bacterium]
MPRPFLPVEGPAPVTSVGEFIHEEPVKSPFMQPLFPAIGKNHMKSSFMKPFFHAIILMMSLQTTSIAYAAELVATDPIRLQPESKANKIVDRQDAQVPDRVHLGNGLLGTRIRRNAIDWLPVQAAVNANGFLDRHATYDLTGEYYGKWLEASTLSWANTREPRLRDAIDKSVEKLLKYQSEDGYFGPFPPAKRWSPPWDVWSHKYILIGLSTYYRYTGNREALEAAKKTADLLCRDFSESRRSLAIGHCGGMSSYSLLEPMVWMYRLTGDERYRSLCDYIVRSWEQPRNLQIVSGLLEKKGVKGLKAYEYLSCVNGMLEWYRITGDPNLLQAALNAWEDIVTKRLYITGSSSQKEIFGGDHFLPNTGDVCETCVTVTWLQFNTHLLRLTNEARFAQQLERTCYNHLCGAQRPDGKHWGYYVNLEGGSKYGSGPFPCCIGSGPRGMAMIPTFAVATDADGVVMNFYDAGNATLNLRDGSEVRLTIDGKFGAEPKSSVTVELPQSKDFAIKLRIPYWCEEPSVRVNKEPISFPKNLTTDAYLPIKRMWKSGDVVTIECPLSPRIILGEYGNRGRLAVAYGPLVLATDAKLNGDGQPRQVLRPAEETLRSFTVEPAPEPFLDWPGAQVFRIAVRGGEARLVPFSVAGCGGQFYQVWPLYEGGIPENGNLFATAVESYSRTGRINKSLFQNGSVWTNDGKKADEDWFALALDNPVTINCVTFIHGKSEPPGGWFDTSAGKPKVQVKNEKGGPWITIGEFADYSDTTAETCNNKKLQQMGSPFVLTLDQPQSIFAVRVIGKPSCGNKPEQNYVTCSGLRAALLPTNSTASPR